MEDELKNGHSEHESRKSGGSLRHGLKNLLLIVLAVAVVFVVVKNQIFARPSGVASLGPLGGGSCCGSGGAFSSKEQLARAGLDYYRANFGDEENLEAVVEDFGCHQEIVIYRDGEAIRRFSFSGGKIYDLTRPNI